MKNETNNQWVSYVQKYYLKLMQPYGGDVGAWWKLTVFKHHRYAHFLRIQGGTLSDPSAFSQAIIVRQFLSFLNHSYCSISRLWSGCFQKYPKDSVNIDICTQLIRAYLFHPYCRYPHTHNMQKNLQSPVIVVQLYLHPHFQTLHVACIPESRVLR